MKINFRELKHNYFLFCLSVLFYIVHILLLEHVNDIVDIDLAINYFSIIGLFLFVYTYYSWFKLTGSLFSLYTIFMLFFWFFNYGQPLMWSLGIHRANEIGKVGIYNLAQPSPRNIVLTQSLTLVSILWFHLGNSLSFTKQSKQKYQSRINISTLYQVSKKIMYISVPVTFFNLFYQLYVSQKYGYRLYYYGDNIRKNFVVLNLLENLFFPTLVGLLVGSDFSSKERRRVKIIFTFYIVINILAGNRGSWMPKLLILFWLQHEFYKTINFKNIFLSLPIIFLGIHVLDSLIGLRNTGINLENFIQSLKVSQTPIINGIFEMGATMRVTIVLFERGWKIWPYSNTYLNAVLGIVSSRFLTLLGISWEPLSDWFSQGYLGLDYGTGFSIVAEALINFGPKISPLFMFFLGVFIQRMIYIPLKQSGYNTGYKIWFSVSSMSFFIVVIRNHFLWVTKSWFYGVVIFIIVLHYFEKNRSVKSNYKSNICINKRCG